MSNEVESPIGYEPSIEVLEEGEAETRDALVATLKGVSETTYEDSGRATRCAWAFAFSGDPSINGSRAKAQLVEFERGHGLIEFKAQDQKARILVGSAREHSYELIIGSSSVHTNVESLIKAARQIDLLGRDIRHRGLALER